jgi:uncharacterized protein (DUF697 family)
MYCTVLIYTTRIDQLKLINLEKVSMSKTNQTENPLVEMFNTVSYFAESITTEGQKLLEKTTVTTGKTLETIANNPILKSADKIIGLDWLMNLLGKADIAKVQATVNEMRSQYPQETPNQIAHRLVVQKAWQGGRLGLLTNIIPPVAALFLGIEVIATAKLQTEMVYEIAAVYGLDLNEPARRGEVLAIFGLSLGADVIKSGLGVVEIIPGIGAVVGASTNAAMLYVLGRTACRFYEQKERPDSEVTSIQTQTDADWQLAIAQSRVMDRILAHMVRVSYPNQSWSEILPKMPDTLPSSLKTIALNSEQSQSLASLLEELSPDFAPLTLSRCYDIAMSNGDLTLKEQEVLSQIAIKFDLDMSALKNNNQPII